MLFLYIALVISLIIFGILLCIKYFGKSYGDIIVEEIEEKEDSIEAGDITDWDEEEFYNEDDDDITDWDEEDFD